jgi:hypothetical protein
MSETAKATPESWRTEDSHREENEITHPIRFICSRSWNTQKARNPLSKKPGESATRTPDWTEIGDPAA